MASLTELAEFVDQVLRLDTDMPVKGFDGFTIGTANEQAQVLANRTLWLKENLAQLSAFVDALATRNVVVSVNKKSGAITLNYKDVGAAAESHNHSATDITQTTERNFVSTTEKKTWGDKQDKLVSGTNVKTLLSKSLLGAGNIEIAAKDITTDDSFQFLSAAEREKWNNKQNTLVNGKDISTLHGHNLLGGGDLTLTAVEVGADPTGSAEQAVDTHEQKDDPHPQYLNIERGDERYVEETTANQPNGYLKLDEKGQIPANIAELFEVRYLIVGSAEERLAIKGSNNVTICLQTDENRIYYLDAGDDPSVEDNWHNGRDADPSAVISVFGRSGVIEANNGDYKTDQITETSTRVFVTPDQKTTWTAKQDKLISGKNIRSINGTSLLGSTDIEITTDTLNAAKRAHSHNVEDIKTSSEKQFVSENDKTRWDAKQVALENGKNIKTLNGEGILGDGNIDISPSGIGAADVQHTHTPDDIETTDDAQFISVEEKETYAAKQDALVSGENIATVFGNDLLGQSDIGLSDIDNLAESLSTLLQAGSGIKIEYNDTVDKIVITNTSQGGTTGSDITVIYADDAKKNTDYKYVIGNKMSFDFLAYALKEKIIAEAKSVDYPYNDTTIAPLIQTPLPLFDDYDEALIEETERIAVESKESNTWGTFYFSKEIDATGLDGIGISSPIEMSSMIIPRFSGSNTDDDSTKGVNGFMPFSSTIYPKYQAWKAYQAPITNISDISSLNGEKYWSDIQLWQSVKNEVYLGISSQSAEKITGYAFQTIGKFSLSYSTMITSWSLQGRNGNNDNWKTIDKRTNESLAGSGEWKYFILSKPVAYQKYRILVNDVEKKSGARPSIARFQLLSDPFMLIKGNDDKWYTLTEENKLKEVTDIREYTFKSQGFQSTYGQIDPSELKAISPFKLYAAEKITAQVDRYGVSPQIIIHTALEKTDMWYTLNSLSASLKAGGDENRICVAVTVDGETWYCLKDNTWTSIGALTNDADSANKVLRQGMTLSKLTAVTKEQWSVVLSSIMNNATLGIAYASLVSKSSDQRLPNKITANFDKLSNWGLTDASEVGVTLTSREIVFTPTVDGSYRFCYKFN